MGMSKLCSNDLDLPLFILSSKSKPIIQTLYHAVKIVIDFLHAGFVLVIGCQKLQYRYRAMFEAFSLSCFHSRFCFTSDYKA